MKRAALVASVLLAIGCGSEKADPTPVDASTTDSAADTLPPEDTLDGGADEGVDTHQPPPPPCSAEAACPGAPAGLAEGQGPIAVERCAFLLKKDTTTPEAIVTSLASSLKKVTITDVLADLDRTADPIDASVLPVEGGAAVPGFQRGFVWNDEDNNRSDWWIPQGLTGTADAHASGMVGGRKAVLTTWYYEPSVHPGTTGELGVRISLADITDATVKYRHLLLVNPVMSGGRANFAPINVHAGGAVWVGDRLYVVDTNNGIRVFDLSRIFEVATDKDSIGWDGAAYQAAKHKYIVPQIGFLRDTSKCNPVFSFVALDRSGGAPSLVSGEFVGASLRNPLSGRVFQWPIDLTTGEVADTAWANGAWAMGHREVQGAVTHNGVFYFSSSSPPDTSGLLYVARPGAATKSYPWVEGTEDLMFDGPANQLWGLGEYFGRRYVFGVDAKALVAP